MPRRTKFRVPLTKDVFRPALIRLTEACMRIRRGGNPDEDMENLCRALNDACEVLGDGDVTGYSRETGAFLLLRRGRPV